jgi:deazaflavin-dependent oxidoreductase (nitroreductase family)
MRRVLGALVVLVAALGALGVVFVIGMRAKSAHVQRVVRRFNRAVTNPRQLRSAGGVGAYAQVVRHVGRRSGDPYETPVVAEPTVDGFVVALPYGASADWVRNVLAAGEATIVRDGVEHRVDRPEVVPIATVIGDFPESQHRTFRVFAVEECLRVRRVPGRVAGNEQEARREA